MSDTIVVSVEALCAECLAALDIATGPVEGGMARVYIGPCPGCLARAREEGYEEGRKDGLREAREE